MTYRLESAKEEERQHISRELHDELGQTLTAAKIQLQLLQKGVQEETADQLEGAVTLMNDMLRRVRAVSLNLRPPLLDEAGLAACLEHYIDTLSEGTGVEISLAIDSEFPGLAPEVETALFRMIQESINNSLRHSGASRIRVSLLLGKGLVESVVEDDGSGFDVQEAHKRARCGEHLGLLGIDERLRGVGGSVEMNSTPGEGTTIRARVPV